MRLKNRKGITAMVDAMMFIVVMGLAVSALFAFGGEDIQNEDASSVSDSIFSAKLRIRDFLETDDSKLVSMPDMVAFGILTGDNTVFDYIENIMNSLMQRPYSYCMEIEYNGSSVTIGRLHGDAVSSSAKEFTATYGGSVAVFLSIC
ncbi:MAG: hypothetical protein LBJ20_05650 [Candidatus Methanoplasma sp.]|jgi:hypothetical protein|nr:hypothetical protein [Candidatus Methanoplasma sp.]